MSKKVLVAYASVSGSTAEVAEAIGKVVREAGVAVRVTSAKDVTNLSPYSAVVLGSSIRFGQWLPEATQFLDKHKQELSQIPVAYFTTCLALVDDTEDSRRTVMAYLDPVLQIAPDINPVGLGLFAGSLDPDRLALPMVRPDLAPQGDYRDWDTIKAWAKEIRPALLEGGARASETIILREAILTYTDMSGTDLSSADMRGADLHGANLSKTDLQGAELTEAELVKADLSNANLHQAGLNWAEMNWANMSGSNLSGANLIGADLSQANLEEANLSQAVLNGTNLSKANLKGADLSYGDLNWADLRGANLSNANLSESNLGWANFRGADLTGVNLTNAKYNAQTGWPKGFSPQAHGGILVGGELH